MYLIQKFHNNGKFITKWGSFGSGNGQFVHLRDVTVDSKDMVYVTDDRKPAWSWNQSERSFFPSTKIIKRVEEYVDKLEIIFAPVVNLVANISRRKK